jgi:holo-[acyl-carrier protein] synthase
MSMRVGIDLVEIDSVQEAVTSHGQRYLDRVFTPREQHDCAADPELLALRFAAKEAVLKILEPTPGDAVPWPSIDVVDDHGARVHLSGPAQELARLRAVGPVELSLSHAGGQAMAVALAPAGAAA